jgi:hypothetical protein
VILRNSRAPCSVGSLLSVTYRNIRVKSFNIYGT